MHWSREKRGLKIVGGKIDGKWYREEIRYSWLYHDHLNKIKVSYYILQFFPNSRFFSPLSSFFLPFFSFVIRVIHRDRCRRKRVSISFFRSLTRTFRPFFFLLSLARAALKWHFFYGKRKAAHVNENLKMSEKEREGGGEKGKEEKEKETESFRYLFIPRLLQCWFTLLLVGWLGNEIMNCKFQKIMNNVSR